MLSLRSGLLALVAFVAVSPAFAQTPSPSPSPSASPTASPSPSPTRSPTASPTASPTPRPGQIPMPDNVPAHRLSLWDENNREPAILTAPLNLPSGGIIATMPRASGRLLGGVRTRQIMDFVNGSDAAWARGYPSALNGLGFDSFPGPACNVAITAGLVGFPVIVDVGDTITGYRILGSIYYASGSGATTFDAMLRRGSLDANRTANFFVQDLDAITQVSVTETATFDETVTLGTPEVAAVGNTYWIEGNGTTDAASYILVTGVYVLLE